VLNILVLTVLVLKHFSVKNISVKCFLFENLRKLKKFSGLNLMSVFGKNFNF